MSRSAALFDRARAAFGGLTEREQKLLGVMVVVLTLFAGYFLYNAVVGNARTWKDGIETRRAAISQVIAARARYAAVVDEQRRISDILDDNTLSIPSFVESLARQNSITRPRDFRDQQNPVADRPDLTADSTVVVFPDMTPAQLTQIARGVVESNHLLFIQRLRLDTRPRQSGYEVEMTLTTFRRDGGGP
mgnify:CR=1 FL=1